MGVGILRAFFIGLRKLERPLPSVNTFGYVEESSGLMRRSGTFHIDGCVIEAHYLWFVREELRNYQKRKKQAEVAALDLILASPVNETPGIQTSGPGNPTASRGVALASNQSIAYKRDKVRWLDEALPTLEPSTRQVLQMLLVEGRYTAIGVGFELKMSEQTVYNIANRGLLALALAYWDESILQARTKKQVRKSL